MRLFAFLLLVLGLVGQQQPAPLANVMLVDGIQTYITYGASFVLRVDAGGVRTLEVSQPKLPARFYGKRLAWDAARLGWILPAGAKNVVVFFYGHRLRERLPVEQDSFFDYEIVGDLVRPQRNPFPSVWHVYFDFDQETP